MTARPLGWAVRWGALALVVQIGVAQGAWHRPWAPGEFDLVIAARAAAAGEPLPTWAAAVHPDAPGTWMEALLLAPLLAMGLPDVVAFRALGALHGALAVAAAGGIATALRGPRAGAVTAALLLLGTPVFASTWSRLQGTTAEAGTFEILLLAAALAARGLAGGRGLLAWAALGGGGGLAAAWSLHAVLAFPALLAVARRPLHRLVFLVIALGCASPFFLLDDPRGPVVPPFSVHSAPLTSLPKLIDAEDLRAIARALPWAASAGTPALPQSSPRHLLTIPWGLLLIGTALAALRGARGPGEAAGVEVSDASRVARVLAAGGFLLLSPLLVAPDLVGFPSAYRWVVPALPWLACAAAVRLAPAVRSGPILALGAVLLGTTGAAILPRAAQGELQRPEAAFLAGQHRLCTPREGLFHHALRLLPWLNEDEVAPFVLGWGLHMGREYAAQLPSLLVQLQDAWPQPDAHPPGLADPLLRRTDPHFWWTPVAALARPLALAYASGLGLGVAEDGLLEAADLALIEAAPDFARMALWEGVGAAMGERATWAGDLAAPRVDGPAPAVDLAAFTRGHRATAPPGQGPPPGWVDPAESGRIELPMAHPFTYAYAVAGRGGPRGSGGGGGLPAPSPAPTP